MKTVLVRGRIMTRVTTCKLEEKKVKWDGAKLQVQGGKKRRKNDAKKDV